MESIIGAIVSAILSGVSFGGVCIQPAVDAGPVSVAVPVKAGLINAPQCEPGGK